MRHESDNETSALKSAVLSGGEVPTRVLLAPWGEVESTHGVFVVDEESARAALGAFAAHGTDVPIDFEHQTLGGVYASPTGQAPAAGWIKRLHGEPGVGLLADIEWTAEARELLAGKQYRFLSPVAVIRKADRKLVAIHSAALTNKPAIVGMRPIVNRSGAPGIAECHTETLNENLRRIDRLENRSHRAVPKIDNLEIESCPLPIVPRFAPCSTKCCRFCAAIWSPARRP